MFQGKDDATPIFLLKYVLNPNSQITYNLLWCVQIGIVFYRSLEEVRKTFNANDHVSDQDFDWGSLARKRDVTTITND